VPPLVYLKSKTKHYSSGLNLKQPDAQRLSQIVLPGAYKFIPDLVLVESGLDAVRGDPLGLYIVASKRFGWIT